MTSVGPPTPVVLAMMTVALVAASAALVLPAWGLAVLLRRLLGSHARAAGWVIVVAALAGAAFWIAAAGTSSAALVMAYGEEISFAHLAAAISMLVVVLWPRGPLRA